MTKYCVISHTHWDREWYLPLDVFRLKLVDLIDELLNIIESQPEYIFHLDAQTIVLEDYLLLRPHNRELLKKYIEQGNILIGPWYLQNDFYLSAGECTIRNLIEGIKISDEFGGGNFTGYAPDQFGNISQLPQILNNFGIDNFIFGRGYNEYQETADGSVKRKQKPSEFIWEGADGSKLTAFFMAFWYNNAQRLPLDDEKIKVFYNMILNLHGPLSATPNLLLMNGVDHLEPQDDVIQVIDKSKKMGYDVEVYTLDRYVKEFKEHVKSNGVELTTHKGELNLGHDYELLRGCWSSRAYLKRENVLAEIALINRLEPLYTMLEMSGLKGVYPLSTLRQMWRRLLQMQPHDNICGCSTDSVHQRMEWEFKSMGLESREMIRRALHEASVYTQVSQETLNDYKIMVANTTQNTVTTVVRVEIEIAEGDNFKNIEIFDGNLQKAEYEIISVKSREKDIFSPLNLPGVMNVTVYTVDLYLKNISPYSFVCFLVKNSNNAVAKKTPSAVEGISAIQNEFIKIFWDDSGLNIHNLNTGKSYLIGFEDTADYGDSYVYRKGGDKPISVYKPDKVKVLSSEGLTKKLKVEYSLPLPAEYLFDKKQRSKKIINNKAIIEITLKKGEETAQIGYSVQNRSRDHRLRLSINCADDSLTSISDIPFDTVSRHRDEGYFLTDSKTHFCSTFAASGDLAFFTEGIHEYEKETGGNMLFTVLRATGAINKSNGRTIGGENWIVPDNQCLREITGRLGVCFNSYTENQLLSKALAFRCPPLTYSTSCDSKKFMGGRTAVQDTRLKEFFYKAKKYGSASISLNEPVLALDTSDFFVTASKLSEDGNSYIIRLLNPHDSNKVLSVEGLGNVYLSDMSEKSSKKITDKLEVSSKKVVTLRIDK